MLCKKRNIIENCHPERISDPAKRETKESKDPDDVSITMLSEYSSTMQFQDLMPVAGRLLGLEKICNRA